MKKQEALTEIKAIKARLEVLTKIIDTPESVFDSILTVEDVLVFNGTTEKQFNLTYLSLSEDEKAYILLKMICKIFNEGWMPDWNNSNQYKYWPYFKMGAGFGFSHTDYYYAYTNAHTASRLCLKDEKTAIHVGKLFIKVYENYLTK